MGTVFLHTLRESLLRRIGAVYIGVGFVVFLIYVSSNRFLTQPDGSIVVQTGRHFIPAETFFRNNLEALLMFAAGLWLFLGLFAAAPLLSSFLEPGWAELLFSKGIARWKILLARCAGATVIFLFALLWFPIAPALYVAARTGISPAPFLVGLLYVVYSFLAVLALLALVAAAQPNTGLLVIVGFAQLFLSRVLAQRDFQIYDSITSDWARWLIEWGYRILPKTSELHQLALNYFRFGARVDWWPVWSTAVFSVAAMALASWLLHRRNI